MNLYRSFGNLMEAWMTEERTQQQVEKCRQENMNEPPAADMGINSESVDSGVETASCGTPCPTTSSSVSSENVEMDSTIPTSQPSIIISPVQSCSNSSSPDLDPNRTQEQSSSLNLKVAQALQRTAIRKGKPLNEPSGRLPSDSTRVKRASTHLERHQRSEKFDTGRQHSASLYISEVSETKLESPSNSSTEQKSEGSAGKNEMGPGLLYLERVCQMLEEYARQQMQGQVSHKEVDALWDLKEEQNDLADVEQDRGNETAAKAEQTINEPPTGKYGHFRRRSASDTSCTTSHLKKLKLKNSRGQHLSTNDLNETVEEEIINQESLKEDSHKKGLIHRLKLGSLRRTASVMFETRSQQMQSSEKNMIHRRLSQLFRRSKKAPSAF